MLTVIGSGESISTGAWHRCVAEGVYVYIYMQAGVKHSFLICFVNAVMYTLDIVLCFGSTPVEEGRLKHAAVAM